MYLGLANGESKVGEATYTPQPKANMQLFSGFGGWVARPNDLVKYAVVINSEPKNDGCGWTMKGALDPAVASVTSYPAYDLF